MPWIFNPFIGNFDYYVLGAVAVLARLTEASDYRITEGGDYRISEDQ